MSQSGRTLPQRGFIHTPHRFDRGLNPGIYPQLRRLSADGMLPRRASRTLDDRLTAAMTVPCLLIVGMPWTGQTSPRRRHRHRYLLP